MTKVLFICMGNICRSPTAEGVFRHLVQSVGMGQEIHIDSAGTHDYHVGNPPDRRAQQAASQRGYDLTSLRGRQVSPADFEHFDYVLAMDFDNLANLQRICPKQHSNKVHLLMEYSEKFDAREVPDPYFGGPQGFEMVLDMVEDAAEGLLRTIRQKGAIK